MRTESVRTIAPFWGGKRCGVDVPLYAANCGKPDVALLVYLSAGSARSYKHAASLQNKANVI